MPKFEGPYRVLERPRQSDTISSDSHVEILYEEQRPSNGSSRSHPGKFKASRKTSSEESKDRKSNKGNAGWEDPRLKRKVRDNSPLQVAHIKYIPGRARHLQKGAGKKEVDNVTRTTTNGTNRAAERRPVRSIQATVVRPCPYYLRSRVKQPEGFPEERRSIGIDSIPQNNIRRRSLSMEALDGDPVNRRE
ncbi:uncharacterized protein TNCV_2043571 [Trichonephila clavipes]|nr:uncharacterized protein TNCV_2043571 [Trichonephila clavipes]